ncbi:MAG: hypothetical protein Kow0089_09330 [Desulfobulbaceae bacterium]
MEGAASGRSGQALQVEECPGADALQGTILRSGYFCSSSTLAKSWLPKRQSPKYISIFIQRLIIIIESVSNRDRTVSGAGDRPIDLEV